MLWGLVPENFRLTGTGVSAFASSVAFLAVLSTFVLGLRSLKRQAKISEDSLQAQRDINERTLAEQRRQHEATLIAQRELASDERLFEKRSTLYLNTMNEIDVYRVAIRAFERDHLKRAEAFASLAKIAISKNYEVAAFSSEPVRVEWRQLYNAAIAGNNAGLNYTEALERSLEGTKTPVDELEALENLIDTVAVKVIKFASRLRDEIRKELQN